MTDADLRSGSDTGAHRVFRSPEFAQFLYAALVPMAREADLNIGGADNPYMRRWFLTPRVKTGNLYLHNVLRPDDDRALHNHPWASMSVMLSGGMVEHTEEGQRDIIPGDVVLRGPNCRHRLDTPKPDTWTIFATGPVVQDWGFFCPQGFVRRQDFLAGDKGELIGAGCGQD